MEVELSRIHIKNLRLRTYIGLNEEEQRKLQDVVISVHIDYDASGAGKTDAVERALDYKAITKRVIDLVESNRFLLLEKLVHDVIALVLDHDPAVRRVEVEADKPHALRFADSVSFTLAVSR